jgi:hypothetical protein
MLALVCARTQRLLIVLATLCVSFSARAQQSPGSDEERHRLIDEASAARASGDDAHALALAMRAASIRMTPSLRLMIADEQFRLGQLIASLGSAQFCVAEAEQDAALQNRDAILDRCRSIQASIEARVGRIYLHLPSPIPAGFRVEVGSLPVDLASVSVGVVTLPGEVMITAHRDTGSASVQRVTVNAGQQIHVSIAFAETLAGPATGTVAPRPDGPLVRQRSVVGPVVLASASGVALTVGFVFLGLRQRAVAGCTVGNESIVCPDESRAAAAASAPLFHDVMTGSLIAGGSLAIGALTWFLLTNAGASATRQTVPRPVVSVGSLAIEGAF